MSIVINNWCGLIIHAVAPIMFYLGHKDTTSGLELTGCTILSEEESAEVTCYNLARFDHTNRLRCADGVT